MKRNIILLAASLAVTGLAHAANPHPQMPRIPSAVFNITNYGAIGDGVTDDTVSIQKAINAAREAGGGTVEIPAGTFESGPITLYSRINLHLDTNAMLQMLPLGRYPGGTTHARTFIYCKEVHDLEISGSGIIDGQGAAWWAVHNARRRIVRPMMLNLHSCNRLFIHDVTFQNPPGHHCGLRGHGGNITISNLTVNTPFPSPNTDGLNFVATNSIIEDCHIHDGDDDIAMGSTGPINDLLITNCVFGTGHGVSFGSGITGVTNVTVINCTFNNTENGLRIKCRRDRSLALRDVRYLNLSMTNSHYPIVFYSYYGLTGGPDRIKPAEVLAPSNRFPVNATTPRWSNITISNLTATSTKIGGIIWGPTEWPITNVILSHVNITAPRTFDLYNVYGVKVIDSQFNFSRGPTFTLCNAGLTISNSTLNSRPVTIAGAAAANKLALYNANVSLKPSSGFGCNPITLSGSVLTSSGNLAMPHNQVVNFALGTKAADVVVDGNLDLNGTINITAANGFTATKYTLFTYRGSLRGLPTLGAMPDGYHGILNTNTIGQVKLVVTRAGRGL